MKCKICNRENEDDYCKTHRKAYENIARKYTLWRNALDISWKEYLSEIAKNPLTGEYAREVAEYLNNNGEKQDD